VEPSGPPVHPSRGSRWAFFVALNLVAFVLAAAIFIGVLYADGLSPLFQRFYEWLRAHPVASCALAISPLACSLLVGYGYARRSRGSNSTAAPEARNEKESNIVP